MLLRTPHPKPTESLFGYILRVSECNGFESPWHVLDLAGYNQNEMWSPGFIPDKLATILNVNSAELHPMRYRASDQIEQFKLHRHLLGGSNKYSHLRLEHPAICPDCIEQNGHIDLFWDLSAAIACPIHGKKALVHCPACNEPISWFRRGLNRCKCGHRFASCDTTPAPGYEIHLMQLLHAKCHDYECSDSISFEHLPLTPLRSMSLRSFLELCCSLGEFASKSEGCSTTQSTREKNTSNAANVLDNWPHNYHLFLKRLGETEGSDTKNVRKRYSSFYQSMFVQRESSTDFQFLKKELIQFVGNNWEAGYIDSRLLSNLDSSTRFIASNKAAELFGVDQRTLADWAAKGKIAATEFKTGTTSRLIVDTESLSPTNVGTGEILRERDAGAKIGLPVSVLKYLKASGHFVSRHHLKHKMGFHEADIALFISELLAKSPPIVLSDEHAFFNLDYVMQEKRFWSASGKGELIAAYLDGQLVSPGRLSHNITSILFLRSDIDDFAAKSRAAASENSVSATDASAFLVCDRGAIPSLERDGYLNSKNTETGAKRFCQRSLQAFSEQYVALLKIGKREHVAVRTLHNLCIQKHIRTLRIPHDTVGESIFVACEDEAKLVEALSSTRNEPRVSSESALSNYLSQLTQTGEKLPRRAGQPMLTEIAKACNFERSVFYKNKQIAKLLSDFDLAETQRNPDLRRIAPVEALENYLSNLSKSGQKPPLRGNKPNLRAIAEICRFKRDCFYEDSALLSKLDDFVKRHSVCHL